MTRPRGSWNRCVRPSPTSESKMSISATRERLEQELLAFAWTEWSQLGILAPPEPQSGWAQDIEALLLFTFEIARADPRLFDEVLDWLVTNEHFISVRRL